MFLCHNCHTFDIYIILCSKLVLEYTCNSYVVLIMLPNYLNPCVTYHSYYLSCTCTFIFFSNLHYILAYTIIEVKWYLHPDPSNYLQLDMSISFRKVSNKFTFCSESFLQDITILISLYRIVMVLLLRLPILRLPMGGYSCQHLLRDILEPITHLPTCLYLYT